MFLPAHDPAMDGGAAAGEPRELTFEKAQIVEPRTVLWVAILAMHRLRFYSVDAI